MAEIILIQEHRISSADQITRAKAVLKTKGQQSAFTPARVTDKRGNSAGTAIIWDANLAVTSHGHYRHLPHRSTFLGLQTNMFGYIVIVSIYG